MPSQPIEVVWQGPFGWPELRSRGHPLSMITSGVYLLTVDFADGYLIYAAGITTRKISTRISEHTRLYLDGIYNVLDIDAMRQGKRVEIWHGFWMMEKPPQRVAEFAARRDEIRRAAEAQMRGFQIFVGQVPSEHRLRQRTEAAIMGHLYAQVPPFSTLPDKGMHLEPRREGEAPVTLQNVCGFKLHCLPMQMSV